MGNRALLAAILYEADFRIDELMLAIARALQAEGIRLRGVVQENASNLPCTVMSLVDLATGERFAISQDLGALARGCRLDPRGLADVTARIDATINVDFDLLILNKFGKAEAEGNGLRNVLAGAISVEKPALTAVRTPYLEAWSEFHGGLAADLAPCFETALTWCRDVVAPVDRAIGEASIAGRAVG